MAWTKVKTGIEIVGLLEKSGIEVDTREADHLKQTGYARICGFDCKAVNVRGNNSFGVIVCASWFRGESDEKPSFRIQKRRHVEFDYQLIPTRGYLFAVYYLALRDYARQLEKEWQRWSNKTYWGMLVNVDRGVFTWQGGNTKEFPLLVASSPLDLELRAKQYDAQRKSLISLAAGSDGET